MNPVQERRLKELREKIKSCTKDCPKNPKNGLLNVIANEDKYTKYAPRGIDYWSDSTPHYKAKIMIISQDWGGIGYFQKFVDTYFLGVLPPPENYHERNNPTWNNLIKLLFN